MAMAALLFLLLALAFPMCAILLFNPSIIFTNQTPGNSRLISIYTFFFYFLVPFEFFSAIILLLLHVAVPQSATFFIKHLKLAIKVLVSATLLLGTPLLIHTVLFTAADPLMVMQLVGASCAVAAVMHPFKRYFNNLAGYQTSGRCFVPFFVALCISMGSVLSLSDVIANHEKTSVPVPIQLLIIILSLNCFTFFLAMVLLFVGISGSTDNNLMPVVVMRYLVGVMSTMSFTTTVLIIAFYKLVPP